jgi:hypothetical protein
LTPIPQDLAKKDLKTLTLEGMEGVCTYQFLLDSVGQAKVEGLMNKVVTDRQASKSSKALPAAKGSVASGSGSSKPAKPSKVLNDGVSAAADMFR